MTSRPGRHSTTFTPTTGPRSASATFGISDGPAYQDIDNPNAALFHIRTEDLDRAMQWFKSDVFKEASRLAKVTGRDFYLAQPQT